MKKNVIVGTILALSVVLFFGCASAPEATEKIEKTDDYRIVDSKAKATGMSEAPKWYDAAMNSRAALKAMYPDSVSVVQTGGGKNLEAIKFELETFGANQELSRMLSTYVNTTGGQTIDSVGNENLEKALSTFTAVASKAEFSGLQKEADFWLLKECKDGERMYTYVVLYLMPQALYNQQVDTILNEMSDEEKEVIQPLVDKAKEEIGIAY